MLSVSSVSFGLALPGRRPEPLLILARGELTAGAILCRGSAVSMSSDKLSVYWWLRRRRETGGEVDARVELDEAEETPDGEAVFGADATGEAEDLAGGAVPAARLCERECSPTTRAAAEPDDDGAMWVVLKGEWGRAVESSMLSLDEPATGPDSEGGLSGNLYEWFCRCESSVIDPGGDTDSLELTLGM